MLDQENVEESRAIHRQTGPTFYLATRFLPERIRQQTYVLYAMFRLADEVVDAERAQSRSPADQAQELESFRRQALGAVEPTHPVMEAFRTVATEHDISDEEIDRFYDAMATDISKRRYESYRELREYMRGSAAAVGVMMTAIMEPDEPDRALSHAIALGEAFQLTNFLRDVREDVLDRDRIYLPQETLDRHGVTDEQIERCEFSDSFGRVMAEELERTESLYRSGVRGIRHLPEDCQFPVLLAAVLYADHHRLIRRLDYDVLSEDPSLSFRRKLSLVCRVRLRWQFTREPEAVFRRVSSVPFHDTTVRNTPHSETLPAR